MDEADNPVDLPARIYIDYAIMLALNIAHMKMVLVAMIEAIFVVMGEPKEYVRQCSLAIMDKWKELVAGQRQTILGLIINTKRLTIAIPAKYRAEVLNLLNSTWHTHRHCFKVQGI